MPGNYSLGRSGCGSQGPFLSTTLLRPSSHPFFAYLILSCPSYQVSLRFPLQDPIPGPNPDSQRVKPFFTSLLKSSFLVTQRYARIALSPFLRAPPNIPVFLSPRVTIPPSPMKCCSLDLRRSLPFPFSPGGASSPPPVSPPQARQAPA